MPVRALALPAALIGFALSGFFDGVLLHQILRWHHLLSALDGDLAFQVAADGWFHAGMYGVLAIGLWILWRRRAALTEPGSGRAVAAWGLIGFGAWHVADAVLSHWLLGIHRIRMDAANPLAWDLGWLASTGVPPLVMGAWLLRRGGTGGGRRSAGALAALAVAFGGWAAVPPPGALSVVAFAPSVPASRAVAAIGEVGGAVAWSDPSGRVFAVDSVAARDALRLVAHGAVWVGAAGLPAGCAGWSA